MTEVGLKDYFKERMWSLKPNGCDYNKAYTAFANTIKDGFDNVEDIKPTKEILIERYSKYIQAKTQIAKNGGPFKDRIIESINTWLMQGIWKQSFTYTPADNPERDHYLYGI